MLEALPYDEWEPTKTTLHLWCQIVGKVALRSSALRNHWWNATLRLTSRGVRTRRLVFDGAGFDIELDFVEHRVVVRSEASSEPSVIPLRDGLSVAEFYSAVMSALRGFGIGVSILAKPYGVPSLTTPFAEDREHHSYDAAMVGRFWEVLAWSG